MAAAAPLDTFVADAVQSHVPREARVFASHVTSNACIDAALAASVALAPTLAATPRGRRAGKAALAGHALGGFVPHLGFVQPTGVLVGAVKYAVQRPRPPAGAALYGGAAYGQSFAFPSGHTTAAVLWVGTLLFALLPAAEEAWREEGADTWADAAAAVRERALPLTAAAGGITAASRVVADVHWLTDVSAGGCLGACMVITLVTCLERADGAGDAGDR
eukprot:PRCOL_00005122-RA